MIRLEYIMMSFLTTRKFCGFMNLRTGGKTLGWIPLMWSIYEFYLSIKSDQLELAGAFAVLALLLVFWIEGIRHEKSAWMFPMVIVWNLALWTEVFYYVIAFYYHVIATSKHPKFQVTTKDTLIMPLATAIMSHFTAVSYSLYKKIDDEYRFPVNIVVVFGGEEFMDHEDQYQYHQHFQPTKPKRAGRRRKFKK